MKILLLDILCVCYLIAMGHNATVLMCIDVSSSVFEGCIDYEPLSSS